MTTTIKPDDGYARMLNDGKVLYVPTCLLIQMITKCYSQMSITNMTGNTDTMIPDMLALINQLTTNFEATAKAYERRRILYFPGDWKNDRVRAKKLLYSVMSRLGYMGELVCQSDRKELFGAVERLALAWSDLTRVCDSATARDLQEATKLPCVSYFKSENPDSWRQAMAQILLSLEAEADKARPGTGLILLCYRRVRAAILRAVEDIGRKNNVQALLSPDKVLCLYNDDQPVTCPGCTRMTSATTRITRRSIRQSYMRDSQIRVKNAMRSNTTVIGALQLPPSMQNMFDE